MPLTPAQKPSPLGGKVLNEVKRMRGDCPQAAAKGAPSSVTCGDSFPRPGKPSFGNVIKKGLDSTALPRYTLGQKVRFRAGCKSPLAVKSATTRKGADPVQLRDQRYSPDARNGRQRLCLRALLQFFCCSRALFCLSYPFRVPCEKGFPINFLNGANPGGGQNLCERIRPTT